MRGVGVLENGFEADAELADFGAFGAEFACVSDGGDGVEVSDLFGVGEGGDCEKGCSVVDEVETAFSQYESDLGCIDIVGVLQ